MYFTIATANYNYIDASANQYIIEYRSIKLTFYVFCEIVYNVRALHYVASYLGID